MKFFILDEQGQPQPATLMEWGQWFETAHRHIADDHVGDIRISTVFLGADHNWRDEGEPLIWETMIFGGDHDQSQWRCSTREQALAQHDAAVKLAKGESPSTLDP
jgi:hypothetical protein